MTYKWNLSEIRTKQRYLLERLKNCKDPKEKELIELSLVSNVSILSNSGSILNTRCYNFLDSLTNGKFSLIKHSKYIEMERKILFHNDSFLDNDYLQFLLNLANNISNDIEEQVPLTKITIRDEDIVKLSKKFYEKLNNPIIEQLAMKILSDPTAINITNITRDGFEDFGGITYNDYVFDKSYINITTVARLVKQKGIDIAVEACKILLSHGYKIRWYVIGEGPEFENIKNLIQLYNIENNFILLGKKTNPYVYMKKSSIYVQPSRYEAFCITVEEAKALKLPVVYTKVDACEDRIKNNFNGLLADIDAKSIASKIEYIIDNPTEKKRYIDNLYKENSKNKIIEEFYNILF